MHFRYAHSIITIPTMPGFSSLNLAQAVLLMCYEWASNAKKGGKRYPLKRMTLSCDAVSYSLKAALVSQHLLCPGHCRQVIELECWLSARCSTRCDCRRR